MVYVGRDYCQARLIDLVRLAAVGSVRVCWRYWVSVALSEIEVEVELVFDLFAECSDVGLEGGSKLQEAAAGSCWDVAMVSPRMEPAVEEDVAFLEPEVELPGWQERRLDQLLDVGGHPAVVPEFGRMTHHVVVASVGGVLVGLDAFSVAE